MQRRTAQATGVSVALHAALLGSVLLLKPRAADGPSRLTIIHAEILPDSGTSTARAARRFQSVTPANSRMRKIQTPGYGRQVQVQGSDEALHHQIMMPNEARVRRRRMPRPGP